MQSKDEKDIDTLEQGSTYEEEGSDGSEDIGEKESDKNKKLNDMLSTKMIVIIGAGLVLLIIIIIGVLFLSNKPEEGPADFVTEEPEPKFEYTMEEVEALRLAGYTGDEIEAFEYEERDSASVIEKAEEIKQKQYEKDIQPYFDNASKEFKKLWKNTWVGQKELDYNTDVDQFSYAMEIMNVDYEKLPPKGYQLFIKFYLDNGDPCFMTVTPERYQSLRKKGNIVLNVEYTQTGDGKRIITSIEEVVAEEE